MSKYRVQITKRIALKDGTFVHMPEGISNSFRLICRGAGKEWRAFKSEDFPQINVEETLKDSPHSKNLLRFRSLEEFVDGVNLLNLHIEGVMDR